MSPFIVLVYTQLDDDKEEEAAFKLECLVAMSFGFLVWPAFVAACVASLRFRRLFPAAIVPSICWRRRVDCPSFDFSPSSSSSTRRSSSRTNSQLPDAPIDRCWSASEHPAASAARQGQTSTSL